MKHSFSIITTTLIALLTVSAFAAISAPNVQASSASEWQLTINGLVDRQITLTIDDLKAMPSTTEQATIFCVDFPQIIVTTGIWKGVTLSTLLAQAGVQPSAVKVGFFADDGYATDLDLVSATNQVVMVAYEKDGEPLSETLRLVVPSRWGYKWISQLTTITLFDYDFKGKWESQGYSDAATLESGKTSPGPQFGSTYTNPASTNLTAAPPATTATNSTVPPPSEQIQNSNPTLEPQPTDYLTPVLEISGLAVIIVAVCASSLILVRRQRRLKTAN